VELSGSPEVGAEVSYKALLLLLTEENGKLHRICLGAKFRQTRPLFKQNEKER